MIYPVSPTNVILVLLVVAGVTAKSYEKDMEMTPEQKKTLEKFKELVIPQIPETSVVHNYIKDDLYFIRWLRAASFDIWAAEKMLLDHLKWREDQNMDKILEEDWSEFQKEDPQFTDTHDRDGRPGAEAWFGEWKVTKAVSSGKGPDLARWMFLILEMGQRQLYEARSKGRKISRTVFLVDGEGFSAAHHFCATCMSLYAEPALAYVNHYPDLLDSFVVVNMSPGFETVISLVKLLLGPTYGEVIQTYGAKSEWESVLAGKFEKSQLSPRFGGTKTRDNHNTENCLKE